MIRITDKSLCTGCTACVNICPSQCIVMRRDREGFDYPVANPDRCTECGRCVSVCPVLNKEAVTDASVVKFPASEEVSQQLFEDGADVYGPLSDREGSIGQMQASDQGQLRDMLTPHYVQTDLYGTFEEVKFDLENGMPVLYIAAPCQLDGLLAYLGKGKYTGLSIMELPCFGAASPGLWEKYSKACAVAETALGSSGDPYMSLFIQGMNLRPSCYRCPVRRDFTRPDRIGRPEEMPEKRSDFFKGYHSATDISKYMKRYVRNPITIFLTRIFTGGKQI